MVAIMIAKKNEDRFIYGAANTLEILLKIDAIRNISCDCESIYVHLSEMLDEILANWRF